MGAIRVDLWIHRFALLDSPESCVKFVFRFAGFVRGFADSRFFVRI